VNKVESAKEALASVNPEITIDPVLENITGDNAEEIVGDSEIILDCLDNFTARYALNECGIRKGIPMVHGAIWGLEGRLTFLNPPTTPCLKCIFPKAPSQGRFPALGAVTCAIGSMQALEAIKYLADAGNLLSGRLLILDAHTMQCQVLEVVKNAQCPTCGSNG
jgi:adenylyltransferase/sulfurtransferase